MFLSCHIKAADGLGASSVSLLNALLLFSQTTKQKLRSTLKKTKKSQCVCFCVISVCSGQPPCYFSCFDVRHFVTSIERLQLESPRCHTLVFPAHTSPPFTVLGSIRHLPRCPQLSQAIALATHRERRSLLERP